MSLLLFLIVFGIMGPRKVKVKHPVFLVWFSFSFCCKLLIDSDGVEPDINMPSIYNGKCLTMSSEHSVTGSLRHLVKTSTGTIFLQSSYIYILSYPEAGYLYN